MRYQFKLGLLTISLLLTIAAVALAQDAKSSAAERDFQRFDGNESGWLSGRELVACQCKDYDKNGDNEVTKAEFFAGRGVTLLANKPAGDDDAPTPERNGLKGAGQNPLAQGQQREFNPGEMVEVGGGQWAKILQCRGVGDNEECNIQYYRGDTPESIPRWENASFLRNAAERVLNAKKRPVDENPTPVRPNTPVETNAPENDGNAAADCTFNAPAGDASRTAKPSAQLFKRKIYDRYNVFVDGSTTAPLKVGVNFLSFQMDAPFTNIVRVDRAIGAYRINDAAPVNATIYPVKTEHIVCRQFRDGTQRQRVENKYQCFKNKDGDWVCGADGIPKTTLLN